jgi:hypothetical protein
MFAAGKICGKEFWLLCLAVCSFALSVVGQGIFIYDQQSAIEGAPQDAGGSLQSQPFGQSFTPTLSAIGFVRFWLNVSIPGNGVGATVVVNLRSNSITGPILSSATPIILPDGFGSGSNGYVNFFFSAPAAVNPGTTYYLQPLVQSGGDSWGAFAALYSYPGGAMYNNGSAVSFDLWFREGIVVPEPTTLSLLIGGGVLFYVKRRKNMW